MLQTLAITLLFGLSLLLWRLAYHQSAWAVAALVPLWAFVFIGMYQNAHDKRRAVMLATLRETSVLLGLMTGRLIPLLSAFLISTVSVTTVALHALLASGQQMTALLLMVAASVLAHTGMRRSLRPHVKVLALSWYSAATATGIAALLFVIPYAFVEWSIVERPGYLRLGFAEAMSAALTELPPRNDWVNEAASVYQLVDSTKLWLASRFPGTLTPGFLYAAHSALICLVIATSAVGAASFYSRHVAMRAARQAEDSEGRQHG